MVADACGEAPYATRDGASMRSRLTLSHAGMPLRAGTAEWTARILSFERSGRLPIGWRSIALPIPRQGWRTTDWPVAKRLLPTPGSSRLAEIDGPSRASPASRGRQLTEKARGIEHGCRGASARQLQRRQIVHVSADKIQIGGEYSPRRENGARNSTQQITYIVTRQGDPWGIQARSTYAP